MKSFIKDKRGFVFTAMLVVFLIVILIFSVVVYQVQERADEKVLSNSYSTRLLNMENSLQKSVRDIYITENNMTFRINHVFYQDNWYDVFVFNTSLLNSDTPNARMQADFAELKSLIFQVASDVAFSPELLSQPLTIQHPDGIAFYKNDSNPSKGIGESMVLYYNQSGKNTLPLLSMSINIYTLSDIRNVTNTTPLDLGGKKLLNITYNDLDYDITGYNPEDTENVTTIAFPVFNPSLAQNYSFNVTSYDGTIFYMNLTLDYEKMVITSLKGDYGINMMLVVNSTSSSYLYDKWYIDKKNVLNFSIPRFKLFKKSKIEFSNN